MRIRQVGSVLKRAIPQWLHDGSLSISASLAFFAVFSLGPLLIISTSLMRLVYKGNTVDQLREQFGVFVSPQAADLLARGLVNAHLSSGGGIGYNSLAALVLMVGASAFTHELQSALDSSWHVHEQRKRGGVSGVLLRRLWTLGFVIGAGILLQVSVLVNSTLAAYRPYVDSLLPRIEPLWVWLDYGVAFTLILLIFWLSYKLLPHARAPWQDALAGALTATILFGAGRRIIAFYIGRSTISTIYGAAGSLMVLLAWFYYSSLIFLLGAKLTLVSAETFGRRIETEAREEHQQNKPSG